MENKKIPLYLAPMAGAGDRAFRETCALFGVDVFCTEMISAKATCFGDKKTFDLALTGEKERPIGLQLFGSEAEYLARAAKELGTKERCDFIDINFGCPVPKIVNNGEGSALMRDPEKIYRIVSQVVEASSLPVAVKIRAGFSAEEENAPQVAALCEKAGACRVAVHGRYRTDLYRDGTVKHRVIRAVKEAVSIPVIGNGDIKDGESALLMLRETGCDGLMVGRAAVGAPWVFAEIRAALDGTEVPKFSKKEVMLEHLRLAFRYKPRLAGREMRMHMAQYFKGFRGAARLREATSHAESFEDYKALIDKLEE